MPNPLQGNKLGENAWRKSISVGGSWIIRYNLSHLSLALAYCYKL